MSLALSICVFFISFMQSINGEKVLDTNCLFPLFEFSPSSGAIDIVLLTSIYASVTVKLVF